MVTLDWTPWEAVEAPSATKGSAVYRFRLIGPSGRPLSIPRFMREDPDGILSIGVSGNMDRRRRRFIRGFSKGRGHSEANLLYIINKYSALHGVKLDQIQYSYSSCPTKQVAEELEEALIKRYFLTFGEPPPLNSAIPRRYEKTGWHDGWPASQVRAFQPQTGADQPGRRDNPKRAWPGRSARRSWVACMEASWSTQKAKTSRSLQTR
jgi:hypothetical protein